MNHLKPSALHDIKSININLQNHKVYSKYIPDLLESILQKFKKEGLLLEFFDIDISTCGISTY